MTLGECFDKIMMLLSYHSVGGEPLGDGEPDRADLFLRACALIDAAQREIAAQRPPEGRCVFAQHRCANLLPARGLYRLGRDPLCFSLPAGGPAARACVFSTEGPLQAAVEVLDAGGTWTTLAAFDAPAAAEPAAYRGVFAPPEGAALRLRFWGGPAFVDHPALYAEEFASAGVVPAFGPFRYHPLPADFSAPRQLSLRPALGRGEADFRGYRLLPGRPGMLGLPWEFEGQAALRYGAVPPATDPGAGREQPLAFGGAAAEAIAYYAAAGLVAEENEGLCAFYTALYRSKLQNLDPPCTAGAVQNSLFGAGRANLRREA